MITVRDLLDNLTESDLDKPLFLWDKATGSRFPVTDLDPTLDNIFDLNYDSEME